MAYNLNLNNKLKLGILINASFTVFEFFIGFISGSLSLMADATQNLTDVLSLIISFCAHKLAQKSPDSQKTYGYGRATILAALLNGLILLCASIFIFYKAYNNFGTQTKIEGGLVMLVGLLGILVNGGVALMFLNHREDLNIQSAFTGMIFDALASTGALISGFIIHMTNTTFIDSVISVFIGCLLLFSSFKIAREAINILLEGVPKNINLNNIREIISKTPKVQGITHLHVWSISSSDVALSCQIKIDSLDLFDSVNISKAIKHKLNSQFGIKYSTIEITLDNALTIRSEVVSPRIQP